MKKIKVCLHNHTFRSRNSINTIEDFRKALNSKKIDVIAITDHDYIHEAFAIQKELGEDKIIVGQEITTKEGEITGLFLKKYVTAGLSLERTVDLIKAQGGLVFAVHPFSKKGIGEEGLDKIKDFLDLVEIHNGWRHRSLAKPLNGGKDNTLSEKWAKENNIPGVSTTDSHYSSDIGRSYTQMDEFSNKEEFLKSLKGELAHHKEKNKVSKYSLRAWVKGRFGKDLLKFIH